MRVDQLTFTRFLAAIAIVLYHSRHELSLSGSHTLSLLISQANIGVSYFFILSGFVMTLAYPKGNISYKKYYTSRIARIYPLYLLALLLVAALKTLFYTSGTDPVQFFLSLFVLQAWHPKYALVLNIPGWTICVEFLFYAIFPLMMNLFYEKSSFKTIALVVTTFWLASQVGFAIVEPEVSRGSSLLYNHPIMHVNQFLLGNLAGLFFMRTKDRFKPRYTDLIILASLSATYLLLLHPHPLNYHNGLLAITFIPFILALSYGNGWTARLFKHKALIYLGEISFGIYILQVPVRLYLSEAFKRLGLGEYGTLPHIICLMVASAICYHVVEKPCRTMINNWASKKKKPKTQPAL